MTELEPFNTKISKSSRNRLRLLAATVGENMNTTLDRMIAEADVREIARLFDKEPLIVI